MSVVKISSSEGVFRNGDTVIHCLQITNFLRRKQRTGVTHWGLACIIAYYVFAASFARRTG